MDVTLTPRAENPENTEILQVTPPYKVAAGVKAVVSSFKHVFGEMSIARGTKALLALNQKTGFDCPSCAWPDPDDDRSRIAEYCENGAKAVADEATSKKLTPEFFAANAVYDLSLQNDFEIGKHGRIAQPMYLPAGATHYQPISWDDAFSKIAAHLKGLASPNEAIFYTSGRTSNEAAFAYQLFVKHFGTNNMPDCSNMCHESSGVALTETIGVGKGTVSLEDIYEAEVILILGQNPGTNHPRMLTALQKAKRNGAKIIAANPLPETGLMGFNNPQTVKGVLGIDAALTDLFLQVRINQDMAMLQALELLLLREEQSGSGTVFDLDFIATHTAGYSALVEHLHQLDPEQLAEQCGLPISQLLEAAEYLKHSKKIIICWAMGLTQHKNAVNTIKEAVNLLLLKGAIGKPGAGACPVRGHSNVQGDRTMGVFEKPSDDFLDKIETVFGFTPPRQHGFDTVDAIHAMNDGRAKIFFAMGGNFLSATPDTQYTANGLCNCGLTVHVSTKLNRSHLVHGKEALILPTLGRSDEDIQEGIPQFVTCENSMGVVQMSKGNLRPVSNDLLSETAIVCRLAQAVFGNAGKVNWQAYMQNYDHVRNDIAKVVPGCENYNERVRKPGGFYLYNAAKALSFKTSTGKANFTVSQANAWHVATGTFVLMTIRSHDQFNTTIYGLEDRYRGIHNGRRVLFINKADMQQQGFSDSELVDIISSFNGVERVARQFRLVPYAIPSQCLAAYFPETNVLVPIDSVAEKSNTPAYKTIPVRLVKHT